MNPYRKTPNKHPGLEQPSVASRFRRLFETQCLLQVLRYFNVEMSEIFSFHFARICCAFWRHCCQVLLTSGIYTHNRTYSLRPKSVRDTYEV